MKQLNGKIAFLATCSLLMVMATINTAPAQMSICRTAVLAGANSGKTEGIYLNEINTRAMRNFRKEFKDVAEDWHIERDGFVAYFKVGELAHWVYYDLKGNWLHTMISYPEDKLPRPVRALVKGTYYDYQINVVREIRSPGDLVYIVQLEDETGFKSVRVNNEGEMELISSMDKVRE